MVSDNENDNITELCAHAPTVASVISRLQRFEEEIEHISVIVTWKGEVTDCASFGSCMPLTEMATHKLMFDKFAMDCLDED